jgi:two-component system sensor histidine kinase ArlS
MLPFIVEKIASEYTNYSLRDQQKKVISVIKKNGIDHYLQGDTSYGSYTLLKEEYIALEPQEDDLLKLDTIRNSPRIIEQDTLNYRVLMYTFKVNNKSYLLEIGKTNASISQYNKPLQQFALYGLIGLIAITMIIDLIYTRLLINPLGKIIKNKLINRKFPFKDHGEPIKTSTEDFKFLDESLITLMEQINEAFEKEREFTANASHEFMTPISILQNKMENLLDDDKLPDHVVLKIIEMMKTLTRLKKIANSLLLISRIENEQFVKSDEVKAKTLISDIIEEIGHRLEEKNLDLQLLFQQDIVLKNVNHDLLFQLFYNLINNAIKYNKLNGKIEIKDIYLNGIYTIVIEDNGIGISETDLPYIFDRFRKSNLKENVGYGLGLSIVKTIATYHGLKIEVTSKIKEGTVFKISFPSINIT